VGRGDVLVEGGDGIAGGHGASDYAESEKGTGRGDQGSEGGGMTDYKTFLAKKSQLASLDGFKPVWMPDFLIDFQSYLTEWQIRKGRGATYADCGLGKTLMQLVFAENCIRKTNKPGLIVTPLAVSAQTVREATKFGIEAERTRNGKMSGEKRIYVTNYEQLEKYDPDMFCVIVCDESSAIKDAKTARQKIVVEFMRKVQYRGLYTATAAPNDFWELGTSSEALGLLGFRDMITTFFKQETAKDRLGWGRTKYRFRGHAEQPFWQWICSWARSIRKPSDIGFNDGSFNLPPLHEHEIVVNASVARDGMLFAIPARDMREEREERRLTLKERCEKAAEIAANANERPVALWCELNPEGDLLQKIIPGCVQVKGSMSDDAREEALEAFTTGQIKRLVTKPKIGAWGLNWQHCSDTIVFPSHSFEQYYQLVHRFYRYGQERLVNVSLVMSEGEQGILKSIRRKQAQADRMFDSIVRHMQNPMHLSTLESFPNKEEMPSWLSLTKPSKNGTRSIMATVQKC